MTKKPKTFQVLAALICDDARREANGKEILIGVYSGNVSVKQLPANITLSAWINLQVKGPADYDFEVRVIDPSGRTAVDGKFGLKAINEYDHTGTSLPKFPIYAEKEGTLKVQIRQSGGRWQTVIEKDVVIGVLSPEKSG